MADPAREYHSLPHFIFKIEGSDGTKPPTALKSLTVHLLPGMSARMAKMYLREHLGKEFKGAFFDDALKQIGCK